MTKRLFSEVSGLRMSIIAHGDYCDENNPYVTKILDFSSDEKKICSFVEGVLPTYGGDAPECYELVLKKARALNWQSGRSKVLIVIGDDVPHGIDYKMNREKIDWRNEMELLCEMGVNVYGVHAMPGCRRHSKMFYEEIAKKTGGFYLTLDQFGAVTDLILACCFKQESSEKLETFEKELASSGRMTRHMSTVMSTLLGRKPVHIASAAGGLNAVPAGRFQTLMVDHEEGIADFVRSQGASFKKGRGFYELTKPEKIQGYKEIVLVDKLSGDIFNGGEVRALLGLPPQAGKKDEEREDVKLRPVDLENFYVFVQSTSSNRKLVANTRLLYEVEDWEVPA
jgi:hypothetical protein